MNPEPRVGLRVRNNIEEYGYVRYVGVLDLRNGTTDGSLPASFDRCFYSKPDHGRFITMPTWFKNITVIPESIVLFSRPNLQGDAGQPFYYPATKLFRNAWQTTRKTAHKAFIKCLGTTRKISNRALGATGLHLHVNKTWVLILIFIVAIGLLVLSLSKLVPVVWRVCEFFRQFCSLFTAWSSLTAVRNMLSSIKGDTSILVDRIEAVSIGAELGEKVQDLDQIFATLNHTVLPMDIPDCALTSGMREQVVSHCLAASTSSMTAFTQIARMVGTYDVLYREFIKADEACNSFYPPTIPHLLQCLKYSPRKLTRWAEDYLRQNSEEIEEKLSKATAALDQCDNSALEAYRSANKCLFKLGGPSGFDKGAMAWWQFFAGATDPEAEVRWQRQQIEKDLFRVQSSCSSIKKDTKKLSETKVLCAINKDILGILKGHLLEEWEGARLEELRTSIRRMGLRGH